ncbi:MAG TPA: hypothetical protein VEV84_05970 [Pyrinomonadaceae bacterium]|nr:hypothetical protein [Pyrinomonadaceae bacterium]
MTKKAFLVGLLAILAVAVHAQQKIISDNSFLIEEAYNQEKGVIQYISVLYRTRNGDFAYSFTNEFPVGGMRHQFSYTVQFVRVGTQVGFGDTFLNYRYQLHGMKEEDKVAIAPRFSVILPTGNFHHGAGTGAIGYQVNVPVSITHSKYFATHWNAGATLTPRARNTAGERANTTGFNLGQSSIYMPRHDFNVLFETVWNRNSTIASPGATSHSYSLLLNPGIRWAYNFKNGLQIVPGLAVPFGVGPSYGERGAFLYLSFEK